MAHFPKPAEGSWTQHWPHLGTAPVSYDDSNSPEFFELEREAIFKRSWLNLGRVEELPKVGSYVTREIAAARTSIILVRDRDGQVRAFHNICRHRGNKLVWQDFPQEETRGSCRQFTCKYHGWRYGLDGELTFVQQEEEFFDLDKADYPLVAVHCEVWEGFIFVNLAKEPKQTLTDFLGSLGTDLAGYPFGEMTQMFRYTSTINANWKLFIDAFAEFYHAPILHQRQAVADEATKLAGFGYEALHYDIFDNGHSVVSSWGGMSPPKDLNMVKPIERVLRSGLFGPWDKPEGIDLSNLPPAVNPGRHPKWGQDSFQVFPNFVILVWEPGWYLTYNYWPLAYDQHLFEGRLYFAPPRNATERMRQELAAVTFKEYALQDGNTLEATQTMLKAQVVTEFPLCDQEILCRNLHKVVQDQVAAYRAETETPVSVR
jgi:phenylpropionate dioxygenase-like ring-hydroxylating dioxygenase large terminal subunit